MHIENQMDQSKLAVNTCNWCKAWGKSVWASHDSGFTSGKMKMWHAVLKPR